MGIERKRKRVKLSRKRLHMVLQTPPYYPYADRLDRLARGGGTEGDLAARISAVVRANPHWRGSAYIQNANAPTQEAAQTEKLRDDAAAIRKRLDERDTAFVSGFHPEAQIAPQLDGYSDVGAAAFWAAQVRCLMFTHSRWDSDAGTTLVLDVLANPLTPANLSAAANRADGYMAQDEDWYSAITEGRALMPTIAELFADIRINEYEVG